MIHGVIKVGGGSVYISSVTTINNEKELCIEGNSFDNDEWKIRNHLKIYELLKHEEIVILIND